MLFFPSYRESGNDRKISFHGYFCLFDSDNTHPPRGRVQISRTFARRVGADLRGLRCVYRDSIRAACSVAKKLDGGVVSSSKYQRPKCGVPSATTPPTSADHTPERHETASSSPSIPPYIYKPLGRVFQGESHPLTRIPSRARTSSADARPPEFSYGGDGIHTSAHAP